MIQGTSSPSKQSRQIRTSASKQRKVRIKKRIGKDAKENKAKPYSRKRHQEIILAYRNVLELPSARELRKTICSKRNTKRKIHTGSTDIYFVSYMSYRTSLASEKREDRFQPTFMSRGGKIPHSKRNLKRKSRKGSTDVYMYLLKRTIELEID